MVSIDQPSLCVDHCINKSPSSQPPSPSFTLSSSPPPRPPVRHPMHQQVPTQSTTESIVHSIFQSTAKTTCASSNAPTCPPSSSPPSPPPSPSSSQCKLNISVLLCMLLLLTCLFVHFWCFNNWLFGWMWMEFTNYARNISYPSFYGREPDLEDNGRLVKVGPHLCLTQIWMYCQDSVRSVVKVKLYFLCVIKVTIIKLKFWV